jgi:hypothetical protein
MGGECGTKAENRNEYKILTGMPEENKLKRRPSRRWVVNIKIELRVIGWSGMNWIDLAQVRDRERLL